MKTVKILRGVPGCGKSTYCDALNAEWFLDETKSRMFRIVSADRFFVGADAVYRFDPRKLGAAHGSCVRLFTEALIEDVGDEVDMLLIVDNTSTTVREMSTYVDLCKAYGVPFEIVTIDTPPEIAAHRNTHGVPVDKVYEMHRRLVAAQIPAEWPQVVVPGVY